jgi:hypothetical protein
MEELFMKMLEDAKLNKQHLIALKELAVSQKQFELGSKLREIQLEKFPEPKEEKLTSTVYLDGGNLIFENLTRAQVEFLIKADRAIIEKELRLELCR